MRSHKVVAKFNHNAEISKKYVERCGKLLRETISRGTSMEKDQYLSALSSGNGKTPFHSFKNDESNGGVCRCLVIYISQSLQEPMATSKAPIDAAGKACRSRWLARKLWRANFGHGRKDPIV